MVAHDKTKVGYEVPCMIDEVYILCNITAKACGIGGAATNIRSHRIASMHTR